MSVPYVAQATDHQQLRWLRILLDQQTTDGALTIQR